MDYSKITASYQELAYIVDNTLNVAAFSTGIDELGHPETTREDLIDTIQYNINHSETVATMPEILELGFPIT